MIIVTYQDKRYSFTFAEEGIYIKEIVEPDNQISLFDEPSKLDYPYDYALSYKYLLNLLDKDNEESD